MELNRRCFLGSVGLASAATVMQAKTLFADDRKRRGIALAIGLNRVDPDHYGDVAILRGCVNDANDVFKIARSQQFECFEPLLDADATRGNVISSIKKAATKLNSGDIFLLHYSGHGSSIEDRNGDEDDRRDETWCLYDGMLIDDELYQLWASFKPGVRIAVLSDSCHSGTVARGKVYQSAVTQGEVGGGRGHRPILPENEPEALQFRFIPDEAADRVVQRHEEFYKKIQEAIQDVGDKRDDSTVKASVLLISGCQDNQLSGDLAANGVFTSALKAVWNDGRFMGSWRAFHAAIVRIMPQNQTPNFYPTGVLDRDFWAARPFTM
jgi:hypothetical protein